MRRPAPELTAGIPSGKGEIQATERQGVGPIYALSPFRPGAGKRPFDWIGGHSQSTVEWSDQRTGVPEVAAE